MTDMVCMDLILLGQYLGGYIIDLRGNENNDYEPDMLSSYIRVTAKKWS